MAYIGKNTGSYKNIVGSGGAWTYNQNDITYNDANDVRYNSIGITATYTPLTKNTGSYSNIAKN